MDTFGPNTSNNSNFSNISNSTSNNIEDNTIGIIMLSLIAVFLVICLCGCKYKSRKNYRVYTQL